MQDAMRELVKTLFGLMALVLGIFSLVMLLKGNATSTAIRLQVALYVMASALILVGGRRILTTWYGLSRFLRRDERKQDGLCLECGYDLTGNESGVCPECGSKIKSP